MRRGLSACSIKWIAIAAMTVDHLTWAVFPGYPRAAAPLLLHALGRIACPIMCFFIAEGYHYTRDIHKYTKRLFLFAIPSHFAYVFASMDFAGWRSFLPFSGGSVLNQTSVLWPLAWGLVMLRIADSRRLRPVGKALGIAGAALVSFPGDWSCVASLCVLAFGTHRGRFRAQMLWLIFDTAIYALVYALAADPVYGALQMAAALAIPVLRRYNGLRGGGSRGGRVQKWLFYVYYPLHLALIGLLQWPR